VSLSSSSTTTQVLAAYADNASYEEDDDLTKARAFAAACRLLLSPQHSVKRSVSGGRSGSEVELDPGVIERRLDDARRWIANKLAAASGGVIHADFTNFRD
jgi:hypothetical protein